MGVSNLYYLHGILLPSGTFLSQIMDTTPGSNTEQLTGYAAGHPHPLFRAVRNQQPDISFRSPAVGQVLTAILAGGDNYALDLSAGNTDLLYKRGQHLGFRYAAAASQHERLRAKTGMLFWQTIQATHRQDAEIACRMLVAYDGVNNALAQVGTGTLTGTPAASQFYTLGPVKLNGSWLGGEQSWSLASGLAPEQQGAAGEPWDSYIGARVTDDIVTITAMGKPWAGLSLEGSVVSSVILYLRAKTADGNNVADGTASHIKIVATNGMLLPEQATGGENNPATSTLRLALRAASSAANPLAITVGAAIV